MFFFIASDWQAVLGQLANGRTAEEFRGAKVQAGATQHSVSCQQDHSGAVPDEVVDPWPPPALTEHYRGLKVEWGEGCRVFAFLSFACLPATPEGFWLMPICLDGTYINHTLIESQAHSPLRMCLLVIALKLCELTCCLTCYKTILSRVKQISHTCFHWWTANGVNVLLSFKNSNGTHSWVHTVFHLMVFTINDGLSEVWI